MNESLLYHLWKHRLFSEHPLRTINGQSVEVINPGEQNPDAGPDFFNGRLKIDGTKWAGNIEIDVTSADWYRHGHHTNKSFSKLILHVVYEYNKPVNHGIPVVELKHFISDKVLMQYTNLQNSTLPIPCSNQLLTVDEVNLYSWLERMAIERFEQKAEWIHRLLNDNNFDWEKTFYIALAKNFGFKINAVPFEMLAYATPLLTLARHKNNLLQLEALLFGQAGLLSESMDDTYYQNLVKEYKHLRIKFNLQAIDQSLWKFARMHPRNFPTIRLAQFAALIHNSSHLFSKIKDTPHYKELTALFESKPSPYWSTHYTFGNDSVNKVKSLGIDSINNILINTIAPFLFLYGKLNDQSAYIEKAMQLLEHIKPENNVIIRIWNSLGVKAKNAFETQSLIQLKNVYCNKKQCLNCAIGIKILKNI